jgi:hypothetical protein
MPAKTAYLIRNSRGHMRTIIGFSTRGAVNEFIAAFPTVPGEILAVKERLSGSWEEFKVS